MDILAKLVLDDGSVLRARTNALPTLDCLMTSPQEEGGGLLKTWSLNAVPGERTFKASWWMVSRVDGWIDGWAGVWAGGQVDGCVGGYVGGWMRVWMGFGTECPTFCASRLLVRQGRSGGNVVVQDQQTRFTRNTVQGPKDVQLFSLKGQLGTSFLAGTADLCLDIDI